MKKFICILLSVLMIVTLLGACADTTTDDGNKDKENSENKDNGNEKKEWSPADATESLEFHAAATVTTLESYTMAGNLVFGAMNSCYSDRLLDKDEEGNLIPALASEWEMAADSMSFTMKIREDVYFHNGNQFTGEDAAYSINLIINDTERKPDAYTKNWRNYVEKAEATSEFEVKLTFKALCPEFWDIITTAGIMVDKETYESMDPDDYWAKPTGVGPYEIVSFDGPNSIFKCTIRTDEHGYYRWKEGVTTNVKDITIRTAPESQTRISALKTGEAQVIDDVSAMDIPDLEGAGLKVSETARSLAVFLQVACAEGDFFDNRDRREALSLAIDRELIVESLLDGYGTACDWPCLPYNLGYSSYSEDQALKYDLERAKELLAGSGYNGEELKFIFTVSVVPIGVELSQALQSMWIEAGFNIKIHTLEVGLYDQARQEHDYDICLSCITGATTDWYKIVNNLTGVDRFNTGIYDQYLRDLCMKTDSTLDRDELEKIYAEVYDIFTTDFQPNIHLYWPVTLYGHASNVSGVLNHNSTLVDVSRITIG